LTENAENKIDGHEIEGQEMYLLKIDYITMQSAILLKQRQNTNHSSKVSFVYQVHCFSAV